MNLLTKKKIDRYHVGKKVANIWDEYDLKYNSDLHKYNRMSLMSVRKDYAEEALENDHE
jgi:hypothetical protein